MPLPLAGVMTKILPFMPALAGLFGDKTEKETTNEQYWKDMYDFIAKVSQANTSRQGETVGGETPTYDPYQAEMRDRIMESLYGRAMGATDLSGYTGQGLRTINDASAQKQRILNQVLASRGLSYSPVAASATGNLESQRVGESVNFMNQIPLLQRQLQGEDLANLASFWSKIPYGRATKSNVNEYGTSWAAEDTTRHGLESGTSNKVMTKRPGSKSGEFISNLGQGLAALYGGK